MMGEVAELRSAAAVRSAGRGARQVAGEAAELRSGTAGRGVRQAAGEAAEFRSGTALRSAERSVREVAGEVAEFRSATALRSTERAGFQTSAPSAVETEEAPAREARRRAVRHIPAAVPANPGRTARERRGEPVRPPSRARVVAGQRGGVACRTSARPSVRWPWLFAIAFAACVIVTGLGVFGSGVSSGPVPSRTASVSVQPGDSLGALAARFAPNADQSAVVERIKELNNLDDTALLPGMPLTVPVAWPGNGQGGGQGNGQGGETGTAGS
ncbi:LysM peptidoglycan-binding domain-containing protein [Amycolatopsis sp. NPDC054798]